MKMDGWTDGWMKAREEDDGGRRERELRRVSMTRLWFVWSRIPNWVHSSGWSAYAPNLLFGKDPGKLRDARNSLSPVVNRRVLDECTDVQWLGSCIVSLVA